MKKTKAFVKKHRKFLETLCLCWIPRLNSKKKDIKQQTDNSEEKKKDMENEFVPHKWSTKFESPEEVLQEYLHFITSESEKATESIPNALDLRYGPSIGQKLDIFGIDLPDDAPILLYIYGGYWKEISKDTSRFPAVSLHKAGVKTIIVGYDQGRQATLWDIIRQVEDAIIYILNYAERNGSSGIYLAGHGSGAHIIAKVLANYEIFDFHVVKRLNGVYFISGIYDLRKFCLTKETDAVNLSKIDTISLSPLFDNYIHLEQSRIRFYILAAEEDSPTFKSQSRDFYDLLSDICPTKNMYLEIKDKMDHYDIVKCFTRDDNYLKNLILHDLRTHS